MKISKKVIYHHRIHNGKGHTTEHSHMSTLGNLTSECWEGSTTGVSNSDFLQHNLTFSRENEKGSNCGWKSHHTPLKLLWSQTFKKIVYKSCEWQRSYDDESERGTSTLKKNDRIAGVQMALKVGENAKDIWEKISCHSKKEKLGKLFSEVNIILKESFLFLCQDLSCQERTHG